jgi:hypothetical protein
MPNRFSSARCRKSGLEQEVDVRWHQGDPSMWAAGLKRFYSHPFRPDSEMVKTDVKAVKNDASRRNKISARRARPSGCGD